MRRLREEASGTVKCKYPPCTEEAVAPAYSPVVCRPHFSEALDFLGAIMPNHCALCGSKKGVRRAQITMTSDLHTKVEGIITIPVCIDCQTTMKNSPSYKEAPAV